MFTLDKSSSMYISHIPVGTITANAIRITVKCFIQNPLNINLTFDDPSNFQCNV